MKEHRTPPTELKVLTTLLCKKYEKMYGIDPFAPQRQMDIVLSRVIITEILTEEGWKLSQVAAIFDKDHSTIKNYLKIADNIKTMPGYVRERRMMKEFKEQLKPIKNKMKELLKITHIKDDICEVFAELINEDESGMLSAAILGAMFKDPMLAESIVTAARAYESDDPNLVEIIERNTVEMNATPTEMAS